MFNLEVKSLIEVLTERERRNHEQILKIFVAQEIFNEKINKILVQMVGNEAKFITTREHLELVGDIEKLKYESVNQAGEQKGKKNLSGWIVAAIMLGLNLISIWLDHFTNL